MENDITIAGTSGNMLDVASDSVKVYAPSGIHAASLKGNAYIWNAVSADHGATDNSILVANISSDQNLVIHSVIFQADVAGQLDFKMCSVTGLTLAGTAIVGINLNSASGKKAPASAFGDETQSAATDILWTWYPHLHTVGEATTGGMVVIPLNDSIIVGYDKAFGFDTILESEAGYEASVIGYFIDAE